MRHVTTAIIGAGQSGLAMSRHLTARSIDHVLFERGEVANSWRKERWDSLRLLTPNWQSRMPGYSYKGNDPDGYRTMPEVIRFLNEYARKTNAPVVDNTTVNWVSRTQDGYSVTTDDQQWSCRNLVLASGACNIAKVPRIAQDLPKSMTSLTPLQYKNPEQLENGGVLVVGASATGVQLAHEIQKSGRQTMLATGEHVRVPRTYRGRDIKWWMDATGVLDLRFDKVEDLNRARRVPSLQIAGSHREGMLDLNRLSRAGVQLVGRLAGVNNTRLQFSGALGNLCALADLKMNRLLDQIDEWTSQAGIDGDVDAPHRFEPTRIDANPALDIDLAGGGIKTIIWATGYCPDYSWLDVPVFDRKGQIRHTGGVVDAPGLYVMGLPYMRRRKSTLIDGAGDDARDLAQHMHIRLDRAAA